MPSTKETELWKALPEEYKNLPVLSFSQYNAFTDCEFKFYLGYIENWTQQEKSKPLEMGSIIHEGMATFYKCLMAGGSAESFRDNVLPGLTNKWLASDSPEALHYAAHVSWLMTRYSYASEWLGDFNHTVYDIEHHFLIPIRTRKGRLFLLQGYVDLITYDRQGNFWIWDHKSGQRKWSDGEILMDPQLPFYNVALREEGIASIGHIINFISTYDYKNKEKVLNEQLFKRDETTRNEHELMEIARTILTRADDWLDRLESRDRGIRNLSRDCSYCFFRTPCHEEMRGTPIEVVLEAGFKKKGESTPTPTVPVGSITLEI